MTTIERAVLTSSVWHYGPEPTVGDEIEQRVTLHADGKAAVTRYVYDGTGGTRRAQMRRPHCDADEAKAVLVGMQELAKRDGELSLCDAPTWEMELEYDDGTRIVATGSILAHDEDLAGLSRLLRGTLDAPYLFAFDGKPDCHEAPSLIDNHTLGNEAGAKNSSLDTRIAFIKRYAPFLQDMLNDPEKLQWCYDHMADNSTIQLRGKNRESMAVDKWGIEKTIYSELMRDAFDMGMVPEDYLEAVRGIQNTDGELKPFGELTDHELICLVGHVIRAERFVENALLFAIMDGTLLRYLQELGKRWDVD